MPDSKVDEFDFGIFDGEWNSKDLDWARAADSYRNFKPAHDYSDSTKFEYGKGLQIPAAVFYGIILAEALLRDMVQLAEKVERRIEELKQFQYPTKDDLTQLDVHEKKLLLVNQEITKMLFELWVEEGHLPETPLRKVYRQIREDRGWYLREELIEDCKSRGGCCGRSCRCCEKRAIHSSREYSIGHCSLNCGCCDKNRGGELDIDEITKLWELDLSSLGDANPARLLALTEAYFAKPGKKGLGSFSRMRSVAWYWRNRTPWQWKRVSRWFK